MKCKIPFLHFPGIAAGILLLGCIASPLTANAHLASDHAFEGAVWAKILEEDVESPQGIVQSVCATEHYIITLENYADGSSEPDIVKAYYRNDVDENGDPVEPYTLAKRVAATDYEHANGMAYNPNTGEIAVALYSNSIPENRGCIFIMDALTLEYKERVQISDAYNILGIGYDEENDRYIIQTDWEGGYSFKILDSSFQIIEDLGEYAHTAKGDNFQYLCVSGDYIINFPLTLYLGIGDFIHVYSISQRELVSDARVDFQFQNVSYDEPESICELEPGVFVATVCVVYEDGRKTNCLYKTTVPTTDTAASPDSPSSASGASDTASAASTASAEKEGFLKAAVKKVHNIPVIKALAALLVILVILLLLRIRYVVVQRERRRKLRRTQPARKRAGI